MNWIADIAEHEARVYSQGRQDGVIEFICEHLGLEGNFCVEVGFDSNTLTGGTGSNTANLVINKGWRCLLLDGANHNPEIGLYRHFLTPENLVEVFALHDVPPEPGYVSIDVDSTDLWLTDAMLAGYRPCFYSVEFNANIPIEHALTFPNDPAERWEGDCVFGASLKALHLVALRHAYSLVYAGKFNRSQHHDAFFIRSDLLPPDASPPLEAFANLHHRLHIPGSNGRETIMLDYEEWLRSSDVAKSREQAAKPARKYLAAPGGEN